MIIHSEKACNYISNAYYLILNIQNIRQSMFCKGYCPQESFFGHMKNEMKIYLNITLIDLSKKID